MPESSFQPFIFDCTVSLTGGPDDRQSVRIFRDTGGSQSIMLADVLPFSESSYCSFSVVLCDVQMGYLPRPVHCVFIHSKQFTGFFPVAVCPALPIKGVTFLMGNDIAGGKVTPVLEVLDTPKCTESAKPSPMFFPSCVVTRAQSRTSPHLCYGVKSGILSLLSYSPVLAAPDLSRPFKLEVDASPFVAGAVLLQEDADRVDHPVSYFSRKFNKHQVHYSTIEQ